MKTYDLLFPCVLSVSQFQQLRSIADSVMRAIYPFSEHEFYQRKLIGFYTAKAISDLREINTNHNSHGYKYNSYLLQLALIKLSFVRELCKQAKSNDFINVVVVLDAAITDIGSMIESTFEDFELSELLP